MKINLPNSAFLGNIDAFFRKFDPADSGSLEITAHPSWISVHPVVLAMIAVLGSITDPNNVTCEPFEAASRHYFERMGLFKFLCVESGINITEHEAAGRFVPLTQIRNSDELERFLEDMIPLLHLENDPEHAKTIRYIVSELVRNVLEHARSTHGAFLAAQFYKKSNTIRIGIADSGVGIRHTILKAHSAPTDLDAIKLALTPGITGTTSKEGGTEQNAGAGLFFIKSIATRNRNFFVVYSGNAMYKLLKRKSNETKLFADPFHDRHSKVGDLPYWQGTVVGIDITLNATEEFTLLLDMIRAIYGEAIRERRRLRTNQAPKFV